jgi:hypothetical protein
VGSCTGGVQGGGGRHAGSTVGGVRLATSTTRERRLFLRLVRRRAIFLPRSFPFLFLLCRRRSPLSHRQIIEYHGDAWRYDTHQVPSHLPSPPITPPAAFSDFPRTPSGSTSSCTDPIADPPSPPLAPMMRRSSSDLFECVEKHRNFSENVARLIFGQIVGTVADLAAMGILHRDLKDENCVISADCRVRLLFLPF